MTELADVSVIMPAWRAAGTIGRALASVAAQTLRPRQVVVVDDGSDDGTFEAAESLRTALAPTELRLIRQSNQGPGAARNRALAEADCTWIAFLDADDEWLPAKLARSLEEIARGGFDLVAHDGFEVPEGGGPPEPLLGSARFRAYPDDPFVGLYRKGFIDTCAVVVRRDLVLAVGGFDPSLPVGQDFDLFLAMLSLPGIRFSVFEDQLVRYIRQPGSITTNTWKRLDCQMRILLRHAPSLNGRPGGRLSSALFRVLAIHKEAFDVFRVRGRWDETVRVLARLPAALMRAAMAAPPPPRPKSLG